jgi:hypothetical protein
MKHSLPIGQRFPYSNMANLPVYSSSAFNRTERGLCVPKDVDLPPDSSFTGQVSNFDQLLAYMNLDYGGQIPAYLAQDEEAGLTN